MGRFFRVFACALPLLLTGCVIGDGVAHVVKLVNKQTDSPSDKTVPPAAATVTPVEPDSPPMPTAAPRDDIKVESLPPQSR